MATPIKPVTSDIHDDSSITNAPVPVRLKTRRRLDPQLIVGIGLVSLVALAGILAPILSPYSPTEPVAAGAFVAPNSTHWFGTDAVGFDVLSRTLHAARIDLGIALSATLMSVLLGGSLGIVAGYTRSAWGEVAARLSDTFQALPIFIVALGLASAAGGKAWSLSLIIALVNAPVYFRLMVNQARIWRDAAFVEAAIISDEGTLRILLRHIIPNSSGPILAQASVNAGWALLLTSGLSFVGAGIQPPTAEWGGMIASGSDHVTGGLWWLSTFPGVAIMLTVLGFALAGEAVSARVQGR